MKIILIGPKHCGKSTVGRELAKLTGVPLVDTDALVEELSGKSPRELYREGPSVFRSEEARAIALSIEQDAILATGGGLIDNPAALVVLKAHPEALLVFLEVSVQSAWERIEATGTLPPFLDTPDPQATHRALHERRSSACRALASLTIAADNKTAPEISEEILTYCNKFSL